MACECWRRANVLCVAVLTLCSWDRRNTAIFQLHQCLIIHPLPFPQSDRFDGVRHTRQKNGWTGDTSLSLRDFFDFTYQNTSFEQSVAWTGGESHLTGDGSPS